MKIIELEQGSEEWLEWRQNGIGASDISILTGSNPYSTKHKLWEQKCGYRPSDKENFAMRHGKLNESKVRKMLEEKFDVILDPICVECDNNSIYRASLDGFCEKLGLMFEIKCPLNKTTIEEAKNLQKIHDYWIEQIQWQMMICNPKRAFIVIYDFEYDDVIVTEILRDDEKIKELKLLANDFWQSVKLGKAPIPSKKDCLVIEDPIIKKLLEEYKHLIDLKKDVEIRLDEVKNQIEEYTNGYNAISYGNRFTHIPSGERISYDYKMMMEDGIVLEKYVIKSPISESFKITLKKSNSEE